MQTRSFRVRMALFFGGLGIAIIVPVFWYVDRVMTRQLTEEHGRMVLDVATSTATVLGENLHERRREVELLARTFLFKNRDLGDAELRDAIERLQSSYPSYSWIGVADTHGVVRSAVKDLLAGANVAERPWFIHGRQGVFLSDVHEALLLAKLLPQPDNAGPLRFIDVAAPVNDDGGTLRGVLGAHINWRWSDDLVKRLQPTREGTGSMQIFIVDAHGKVIYPESGFADVQFSAELAAQADRHAGRSSTTGGYVSAIAPVRADPLVASLGWRVIARQPDEVALRSVYALQQLFIGLGLASAIVFVLAVMWMAATLSRPLERLARDAKRIEAGEEESPLTTESGTAEISNLAGALHGMTATLIRRRQELAEVNRTLEQKVHERTAELEEANEALRQLARRDALTGLDNRLSAQERLHEEWLRMLRSGRSYGVMMLDIDRFKRVNDTHGHDSGDVVLKAVAATIKGAVRVTDFAARFGGEEFLVLVPEASVEDVAMVAEKIRRAVEGMEVPKVGTVTISVGATVASAADGDEHHAVKVADDRLYAAKHRGRNRVVMNDAPEGAALA